MVRAACVWLSGGSGAHESRRDAALQRTTARCRAQLHERSATAARRPRDPRQPAQTASTPATTVTMETYYYVRPSVLTVETYYYVRPSVLVCSPTTT